MTSNMASCNFLRSEGIEAERLNAFVKTLLQTELLMGKQSQQPLANDPMSICKLVHYKAKPKITEVAPAKQPDPAFETLNLWAGQLEAKFSVGLPRS